MQKSSFFNSIGGDRKYKAEEWAEYFGSFIGNGVFPNPSTNLMVVSQSNMTVVVKSGKAWINGYFYVNTDDLVLQLSNADGVLKRIDRIVLRWSLTNRNIEIAVKKGAFASSPVAPNLQRDADIYEIALADVKINNGTIQITQTNITDQRQNSELCGLVTGTVNQIDATGLFAQYEQAFNEWFGTLDVVLDENVAANLLTLINQNTTNINANAEKINNITTKGTSTIPNTGWTSHTGKNTLKINLAITGVTANDWVDIIIDEEFQDVASDAEINPTGKEYAGGVTLYANTAPALPIPISYKVVKFYG